MSKTRFGAAIVIALAATACGGRTSPAVSTSTSPGLTTATVTFATLSDGKDAKSAVSVQLLRNGNELAADGMTSGTEFDDNSTSSPIVLNIRGPFARADAKPAQLRLRLTPDGDDTWTFNVALGLRFSDESQQTYRWSNVRLDEKAPERTLVLAGAESP